MPLCAATCAAAALPGDRQRRWPRSAALDCAARQVGPGRDHLLVIARVTSVPGVVGSAEPGHRFSAVITVPDRLWCVIRIGARVPDFDTSVPHIARVYDYWLGGKDNFAADRELGERTLQAYPNLVFSVRANRAFLARTVRFLAAEAGIRQFLDIGTGIPANDNTHQVAQGVAPGARIVYVDTNPIVLSHARALLTSNRKARRPIDADLREPDKILASAADTLDFSQPVALMLVAVMHFISDDSEAGRES